MFGPMPNFVIARRLIDSSHDNASVPRVRRAGPVVLTCLDYRHVHSMSLRFDRLGDTDVCEWG